MDAGLFASCKVSVDEVGREICISGSGISSDTGRLINHLTDMVAASNNRINSRPKLNFLIKSGEGALILRFRLPEADEFLLKGSWGIDSDDCRNSRSEERRVGKD